MLTPTGIVYRHGDGHNMTGHNMTCRLCPQYAHSRGSMRQAWHELAHHMQRVHDYEHPEWRCHGPFEMFLFCCRATLKAFHQEQEELDRILEFQAQARANKSVPLDIA